MVNHTVELSLDILSYLILRDPTNLTESSCKIMIKEIDVNDQENCHSFILQRCDSYTKKTIKSRSSRSFGVALSTTFLPVGYPHSVRPEYLTYQLWDSLQGISSYLRSVLTTKALLAGAGVGSTQATPLSAAIVWITRDGIGMIGSLTFAYMFANYFEVNVKEWRLLADALNNIGLTLDLFASSGSPTLYALITSLSTISKSLCGLIAGATKARISSHFAMKGHLADITAKESTQETAVALVGLLIGMVCAQVVGNDTRLTWIVFFGLMLLHQWANYNLVRVLVLDTMNPQRIFLIVSILSKGSRTKKSTKCGSAIPTPSDIAANESLLRPFWLYFFGPRLGGSVEELLMSLAHATQATPTFQTTLSSPPAKTSMDWESLRNLWGSTAFVIGFDSNGREHICLATHCSDKEAMKAYFIACYLHHTWNKQTQHNHTAVTQHAYGGYSAYFTPTKSHLLVATRYSSLYEQDAREALNWFDSTFADDALDHHGGWNTQEGSTRLGAEQWRYSVEPVLCPSVPLADVSSDASGHLKPE